MLKELFEIESKQKNVLIILIGIMGLSFLQIFILKKSIFDLGILQIFGISIGITMCWVILNIPSMILCFLSLVVDDKRKDRLSYENIIFTFGLLAIGWIALFTYIAYEFNFTLRTLIHYSIGITIIRLIFWSFYFKRKVNKLNKAEK